jgi:23S rRNA (pseudouridine1915-N3)-methyltransferase
MRDIKIVCVGKIKEQYFLDGIGHYLGDIQKKYPVSVFVCADEPTPDKASKTEEEKIRQTEGNRILQKIQGDDYVIALCIDGKHYDSQSWQKRLTTLANQVQGSLTFVIGGSLGLASEVVRRANEKLSFSAMTFPHQMMRMILCEQLADWVTGS